MHVFLVEKREGNSFGIVFYLQRCCSSMESKIRYNFKRTFLLVKALLKTNRQKMLIKIHSF